MQSLVDYGSEEEEEEPTPSTLSHSNSPSLPHSSSSSSSSSEPSPLPPPHPIEYQPNEIQQLLQQEEERAERGDRDGGRGSPYTEEIINKLQEEMDHVVNVHSWTPQSPLHSGRMERVRYNLISTQYYYINSFTIQYFKYSIYQKFN